MKNDNKPNSSAPDTSQENARKEIEVGGLLERIDSHLAQGIKLQWAIVRTLQSIDDSIELLASQKARELSPEKPKDSTDH